MKKVITAVVAAALAVSPVYIGGLQSAEACENTECRTLFVETLNNLLEDNAIVNAEISAETEKVYDMELRELGCLYDFTVNGTEGFAMMIYFDGRYEISEAYLDAENPYEDCNGIKVYPAAGLYLCYEEGEYYDTVTDAVVCEEAVAELKDIAYSASGGEVVWTSEYVQYTYRSEVYHNVCSRPPQYRGISGINNICVPIAAGNIVGYWDRFYPDLIPDYEPGIAMYGEYFYNLQNDDVDDMIRQLASDMGAGSGTTIREFKSGMTAFCNRAGYSVQYSSIMSFGSFNYSAAKSAIDSGLPIIIFSQGFTVYMVYDDAENSRDVYSGLTCDANHAMAGFGYLDVTYTYADGSTGTTNFIKVASGQIDLTSGYFNIKTHIIDDAYSVTIS